MKNNKFFLITVLVIVIFFVSPSKSEADTIWCHLADYCNFGCAGDINSMYPTECPGSGSCVDNPPIFCEVNPHADAVSCFGGNSAVCDPVYNYGYSQSYYYSYSQSYYYSQSNYNEPPCAVGSIGCCRTSADCRANDGGVAHCCDDGQGTGSHLCASSGGGPYCISYYTQSSYNEYSEGGYQGYSYGYGQGAYGPPSPDLIISAGPSPSNAVVKVGDVINFDSTVKNQSSVNISNIFGFLFKVDGISLSSGNVGGLGGNESTGASSSNWPAQGVGTHHVQVCADHGGAVSESNEGNNCASRLFEVRSINYSESGYSVYGYGQSSYSTNTGNPNCEDSVDNDGDNWVDFKDPGCLAPLPGSNPAVSCGEECSPVSATQCSDGVDNDGDGRVDGFDKNCRNFRDNTEKPIFFIEF
jgi:hypothetical protein